MILFYRIMYCIKGIAKYAQKLIRLTIKTELDQNVTESDDCVTPSSVLLWKI